MTVDIQFNFSNTFIGLGTVLSRFVFQHLQLDTFKCKPNIYCGDLGLMNSPAAKLDDLAKTRLVDYNQTLATKPVRTSQD